MKCCIYGQEADFLTQNDDSICERCAENAGYVVCSRSGKVIEDRNFYCNHICAECVWEEEK